VEFLVLGEGFEEVLEAFMELLEVMMKLESSVEA
jgi:hypothetical protein